MKSSILLLCFALAGATTMAPAAEPAPAAASPVEPAVRLQELSARLDLTADQKTKITAILRQEAADLRVLKDDSSLRRLQRLRRAREVNQKAAEQIRALLTPEQQPKYDELRASARAELKQRLKERRHAGTP